MFAGDLYLSVGRFEPRVLRRVYARHTIRGACVYVCLCICVRVRFSAVSHNCFYFTSKPECAIPDDNILHVWKD
jgi:hypothetical protein